MLHKLIDHSPDLKRLRDEGYEIKVQGSHLLLSNVPYLNAAKEINYGILVSDLTIAGERTGSPANHVIYFIGDQPCHKDGTIITALIHGQNQASIADGIEIDRSFSNKPSNGYADYYEKFTTYINIISGPAQSLDPLVKVQTFRYVEGSEDYGLPFNYPDTNSSRSQITSIADKLREQKIGIIGIGGTGSYILDFVSKTPVKEIHIFDNDQFVLHNAFRAPGAPSIEALKDIQSKVGYFYNIYSRMHNNIVVHDEYITEANLMKLNNLDFVFICVDTGNAKKTVINYLKEMNIDFVDVGIGLEVTQDQEIIGMVRTTSGSIEDDDKIKDRISFAEPNNDIYSRNIQIAELNALNAALATIKWKKKCRFYFDAEYEHHCIYTIDDNSIINETSRNA